MLRVETGVYSGASRPLSALTLCSISSALLALFLRHVVHHSDRKFKERLEDIMKTKRFLYWKTTTMV